MDYHSSYRSPTPKGVANDSVAGADDCTLNAETVIKPIKNGYKAIVCRFREA